MELDNKKSKKYISQLALSHFGLMKILKKSGILNPEIHKERKKRGLSHYEYFSDDDYCSVAPHSLMVAAVAVVFSKLLNVDIISASLLHDAGKKVEKNLENQLKKKGWKLEETDKKVEEKVERFFLKNNVNIKDINITKGSGRVWMRKAFKGSDSMFEQRLMYYADMLVIGTKIVSSINERVDNVIKRIPDLKNFMEKQRELTVKIEGEIFDKFQPNIQNEIGSASNIPLFIKQKLSEKIMEYE